MKQSKKKYSTKFMIDYCAKFYLFPLLIVGLILRGIDNLILRLKYKIHIFKLKLKNPRHF